jgi:hypothetical protein
LDCENESDGKGHASEKSDRLKESCPASEGNENDWENDIADAGRNEDENFAGVRNWKLADGSTSATPAIVPRSIIRPRVIPNSTSASPTTPSTPPTTTLGPFGAFPLAYFIESHPAIALGEGASVTFFGTAHFFFFFFNEATGNPCRRSLCFD